MALVKSIDDLKLQPKPDFGQLRKALTRDAGGKYIPLYELYVNGPIMEKILGKKILSRADTVEFYFRMGYDYVPAWPGCPMKTGSLVDTRLGYPIKDWETFAAYEWPDVSAISLDEFASIVPRLPAGMGIIAQTGGIFEMAESLCGYEGLCYLLLDDRKLVKAVFDKLGAIYEAMYAKMSAIPEVGAVVISDDLGYKTQTLIAPEDLKEFVIPWHARLARIIHDNGKPCILHSCGQLREIMEILIEEVEIDAKHSFEDVILPVTQAKRLYGSRIALLGGFDVDKLCGGGEAEIRGYVRRLMEECGAGGGYALGSGNSIADYVPVENYLTMVDEAMRAR
jgi:uroporphyrinogen decarboxylase